MNPSTAFRKNMRIGTILCAILAIVIFTGFAIPTRYMLGWSRWINYIDPVAYGFEALMINVSLNQEN